MWARSLRIEGIDPVHARNLWALLTLEDSRSRRQPMALALLRSGRPVHLMVGKKRRTIPQGFDRIDAANSASLAAMLGVRLLVAVEEKTLASVVSDIQDRWRIDDDNFLQTQVVLERIRAAIDSGEAVLWPDFFKVALGVDAPTMRKTAQAVFPPRSSMIMYVFRKQAIHSALIAVKGQRYIEAVTGHWSVRSRLGTFHPWQDGYPRILEAVASVHAPPCLGLFIDFDAAQEMLHSPHPGQLSRAILARRAVIDPLPAWAAAALGLDAMSRAARISMDLIERMDRFGIGRRFDLGQIGRGLRSRIDEKGELEALLGFDPFDYFSKFLSWWSGRAV